MDGRGLYSLTTGKVVHPLRYTSYVSALTPDGQFLFSGRMDGTIRMNGYSASKGYEPLGLFSCSRCVEDLTVRFCFHLVTLFLFILFLFLSLSSLLSIYLFIYLSIYLSFSFHLYPSLSVHSVSSFLVFKATLSNPFFRHITFAPLPCFLYCFCPFLGPSWMGDKSHFEWEICISTGIPLCKANGSNSIATSFHDFFCLFHIFLSLSIGVVVFVAEN